MAKHEELLQHGPRQAPEPETAEQRSKRLGWGSAAGGAAAGGAALAKFGFLKFFLWLFAWHGFLDLWRISVWVGLAALLGLIALAVALHVRREA